MKEKAAAAAGAAAASKEALAAALEKGDRGGREGAGRGAPSPHAPRVLVPEELDEMVKSVQAVLGGPGEPGGLGEGFVEACLSVLGWSPQVREEEEEGEGRGGIRAGGEFLCRFREVCSTQKRLPLRHTMVRESRDFPAPPLFFFFCLITSRAFLFVALVGY